MFMYLRLKWVWVTDGDASRDDQSTRMWRITLPMAGTRPRTSRCFLERGPGLNVTRADWPRLVTSRTVMLVSRDRHEIAATVLPSRSSTRRHQVSASALFAP